jgi:hypothetical protein
MLLAHRLRAQIPIDRTVEDRMDRSSMAGIADRLEALASEDSAETAPWIALTADDWCHLEDWGLVRRVRQRGGLFTYEPTSPQAVQPRVPPPIDHFMLPPSVVDGEDHSLAPVGSSARINQDLELVMNQLAESSVGRDEIERVFRENANDPVDTLLQLQRDGWRNRRRHDLEGAEGRVDPDAVDGPQPVRMQSASHLWPDLTEASMFYNTEHLAAWVRGRCNAYSPRWVDLAQPKSVATSHALVCSYIDAMDEQGEAAPPEFFCPLSHLALRQPVACADGHVYECAWVLKAFNVSRIGASGDVTSPMTRESLSASHQLLYPCFHLVSLMQRWVEEHLGKRGEVSFEDALAARLEGMAVSGNECEK